MAALNITDLAGVVYSSGKVFDGLRTGRLDTENFLRSGSLEGVTSRSDLALLQDMRDVAQFVVNYGNQPIDARFVCEVNAQLTRSAAIEPGKLRAADPPIGVNTRHGRHDPKALTDAGLQQIIDGSLAAGDPDENALDLFVDLAKAQPFQDGNKRTALFVANARLLGARNNRMLTIPVDENDPSVADRFNDLLARAYMFDEHDSVKGMLRETGLVDIEPQTRL
ncbi:Fic family protein [Arthrobacter castelli]|uniref:Fic family protein n=1 Tax=Arthrobacter castelli TaxID=271431 RepID=UPI000411F6AF|nr:Fic family protein [Arthrobacter castelli]